MKRSEAEMRGVKLSLKHSPCTVGVDLQSLFIGITCLCCFLTDGRRNTTPVTLLHSVLSDVRSKYIKCGARCSCRKLYLVFYI